MRQPILALLFAAGLASAGHTRQGYVDGGRSADGRYAVTAEQEPFGKNDARWKFTWSDAKTGDTHTGTLVGVPFGLDHFRVAYTHIFVPPGGETFAVWQPASWTPAGSKPPKLEGEAKYPKDPPEAFKTYAGFGDRLVVYKKTGEVVKRLAMSDVLKADEWMFVNWVQGNLYWLREYPEVMEGGEPPRCGYRYYRVSPDYSVLEFTVGPNADAVHRVKPEGPAAVNYRRVVRVSLTDGVVLDPARWPAAKDKVPVRPFVGGLTKKSSRDQRHYVPSLDPVRLAGKVVVPGAE